MVPAKWRYTGSWRRSGHSAEICNDEFAAALLASPGVPQWKFSQDRVTSGAEYMSVLSVATYATQCITNPSANFGEAHDEKTRPVNKAWRTICALLTRSFARTERPKKKSEGLDYERC